MRAFTATLAIAGLLAIGLCGCSAEEPAGDSETPAADTETGCAECEKGEGGEDTFCAECKKGYVGGEMVTACAGCFAAKTGGVDCPT